MLRAAGAVPPGGRAATRYEAAGVSGRAADYLFGQSAAEAERLRLQARMFAPYTARFLQDAGISPGMKVLDVGTGAGDVALLAAGLAGQQGAVVGIDFNAELIQAARARAAAEAT
jgi:cyclopropane fatty-acyl-phospholipid synthase-like methyltransferase